MLARHQVQCSAATGNWPNGMTKAQKLPTATPRGHGFVLKAPQLRIEQPLCYGSQPGVGNQRVAPGQRGTEAIPPMRFLVCHGNQPFWFEQSG
jgi:hypothetical protein